ncbi:hypothetical protein HV99_29170 [Pseudomonas aeruginosa]|nr:hypothetical protein HV99_29170 [Pseudomonas aeruginosa]
MSNRSGITTAQRHQGVFHLCAAFLLTQPTCVGAGQTAYRIGFIHWSNVAECQALSHQGEFGLPGDYVLVTNGQGVVARTQIQDAIRNLSGQ